MELKEALLKRRSVRKFTDEAVSDEYIDELLHAAMSGPSACNKTPWEFYVIKNSEKLAAVKKASRFSRFNSPLAIVVCGNLSRALPMQLAEYWIQDCSAATENILLRATDLGLGAVWCGAHPQARVVKKIREVLDLPEKHVPLGIIHIGHPAESPEPRDQYDEKRVHFVE
ncbi:MAG: nitroreductase family protein [Clostridia bacterium]|nr:nitroreductase family protein [Clostridia bacterium]